MEVQDAGLPRSESKRELSWSATYWSLRSVSLGWEAMFGTGSSILTLPLPDPGEAG